MVAARSLDEGAAWVAERLGAQAVAGGKHATMGTHNRLLAIGAESYLEVIAIDPDALAPGRPRWFELDTPAMRERLARGPALVHWVDRTDDLEASLAGYPPGLEILSFSRGPYRWRMALMRDGSFPAGGTLPTLIQWDGEHPLGALPRSTVSLAGFTPAPRMQAAFDTPAGLRTIP